MLRITICEIMNHEYDVRLITAKDKQAAEIKKAATGSAAKNSGLQNLNPNYTFDTFVVGTNNNLAHAASLAVAETPGQVYNPLFIYGGVGLGKTHLMQAIAHFIITNDPTRKVLYVTSETFTNELIDSVKNQKNSEFRKKYRNIDVLLIDDIQFIIGKESTQEEFFHTFNALYQDSKQIVISSDRPPKEMETLTERLRTRFEMGLPVDIQIPTYETKRAILKKKVELGGYNIPDDVQDYVATHIKSSIRELEGALTKLSAFATLSHSPITVEFAEETLKDLISPDAKKEVTPELIIQIVADHFGISPADTTRPVCWRARFHPAARGPPAAVRRSGWQRDRGGLRFLVRKFLVRKRERRREPGVEGHGIQRRADQAHPRRYSDLATSGGYRPCRCGAVRRPDSCGVPGPADIAAKRADGRQRVF